MRPQKYITVSISSNLIAACTWTAHIFLEGGPYMNDTCHTKWMLPNSIGGPNVMQIGALSREIDLVLKEFELAGAMVSDQSPKATNHGFDWPKTKRDQFFQSNCTWRHNDITSFFFFFNSYPLLALGSCSSAGSGSPLWIKYKDPVWHNQAMPHGEMNFFINSRR